MGKRARTKRWYWIGFLAVLLLLAGGALGVPGAWAQDYKFTLDRNISRVWVNRDGSADIEYWLTFTCAQGAHPIDIVEVGLPNDSYRLSSARAWYSQGAGGGGEVPLTDIRKAEYLEVGIDVYLGNHTIRPGQQGTLHVVVNVGEMVYPDQDEAYASVEFAPTFYGSQYVQGKTHLEIQFLFPPGVTNEETRWHGTEPDEYDLEGDRLVFIYQYPDASGDETHQHGISFPRTYVDQVHKAPVVVSTGETSSAGFGWSQACTCIGIFALFGGGMALSVFQSRKRKLAYLPPALSVEGVGVKRGLTAVEAAILLEKPLNTVLTMVMFGLLKKRAIVVQEEEQLRLEKVDPLPDRKYRAYESHFLEAIQPDGTLDEAKLQEAIITLVKSVNKRMKGFSRKETVTYYRSIVTRAWEQVQAGDTPEIKSKYFDQGLEWMMMDEKFEERTARTFSSGPVFMPPWWAHYRPWVPRVQTARTGSGSARVASRSSSGGRQVTLPTLPGAAFASTLVSGMERTAGGIVGRLERFTSGVTSKTNPLPKTSSSSSSSFKSGGCACACACACAGCACACAGGGR